MQEITAGIVAKARAFPQSVFVLSLPSNLTFPFLDSSAEPLDRRHHQYSCGCESDEDALEVGTQWVRNKISHFSSCSMLR